MNIQSQSQDRLAKLLATENITIVRGNVHTASFDIKNRTLILPRWKEMTPEVEEMLMLHEVGHALYTTVDSYSTVFDEKKYLKDYANVIEDVRIERKMKERYPGSRKSFNAGYKQLCDRDFFSIKNRDLGELLLIDRINLYYKAGFNCGVKFTEVEHHFVRKADKCETVEDVLALAQEIYDFSKASQSEDMSEIVKKIRQEQDDEDAEYEFSNSDDDFEQDESEELDDEYEYNRPIHDVSKYKEPEEDITLEPETMKAFDKKLQQLADDKLRVQYYEPAFENTYKYENIIPYRTVLSELQRDWDNKIRLQQFKAATTPVVNYLIKEFEMKKSATAYKRAKVAKLGTLDSKKLYAYKLKDDLFRQVLKVQEGKKHGMIFLLDWSGSMSNCIEETVEQVVNLAMFCQRIQIPYQVFAFTDGYHDRYEYDTVDANPKFNPKGLSSNNRFNLIEFFNHKMTNVEFNKMIGHMLNTPWGRNKYGLNGTPLNEALLFMTDYVGKFIRDNQVEKMSFITLTDGEGTPLYSGSSRIVNGLTYDESASTYTKINKKCILQDPMTKRDYDLSNESNEQTSMLLNIIRDRWNVKTIGFFLMASTYREAQSFIKHNMSLESNQKLAMSEKIVQELRKNKFHILENVPGRDEFYLLNKNVKVDNNSELGVDDSMNSGQLARQLTKVFNNKKTSRVVLSRFIEQVS